MKYIQKVNTKNYYKVTQSLPCPPCSSLGHRMTAASPSTLSISGAGAASSSSSSDRCRLTRGSTIRSTFHGGQLRDRGPPVYSAPPTSPTLSHHDASPLPHARTRATSNLFTKLTSKLTRRQMHTTSHITAGRRKTLVCVDVYLLIRCDRSEAVLSQTGKYWYLKMSGL